MAQKDIIGTFIFRNEGNGCLTGKYANNVSTNDPYPEASKRTAVDPIYKNDVFCGIYRTVWIENNLPESAQLRITKNLKDTNKYELAWYRPDTAATPVYKGMGILSDGLLIGDYWNMI